MDRKTTLYKPFVSELNRLKEKYGEEMFRLSGISDEQLDESKMMDKLIDSNVTADVSIDPTSNIGNMDIDVIMHEVQKPQFKIKSLNRLFKDMVNLYGIDTANEWLEKEITGALYLHDGFEASFKPYCYNYTCETVAKRGMFFDPALKADVSKHLHSFHEHMLEFVRFCTKRQSGSVGIGDFLIWSFYFFNKDKKDKFLGITDWDKYKEQNFQNFVYSLNQSGARSGQSAFTNVSIFDREYLYALFAEKTYPDNTLIIDYIEDIIQYQKDFLDFLKKERAKKLLTFPVLGASLLFKDGKFVDEEFARFCSDHIYLWKDLPIMCEDDVTSVSSCCFDGSQKALAKGKNVIYDTFENIHKMPYEDRKNFRIFHNGNWVYGKLIKIPKVNKKTYKITTSNKKELFLTEDHLNLTTRGDVFTNNLTINDYLAFSTKTLGLIPERDLKLTYEQGILIGAYLGDGSKRGNSDIIFSFNEEKIQTIIPLINKAIKQWGIDVEEKYQSFKTNCCNVGYNSSELRSIVETWVYGNYCYEKDVNLDCLLQSKEFREGIIDGLYMTDGGNSNRIYSTSKKQTEALEVIMTSLGIHSTIDISDRTGDGKVVIREEEFNRNYPLYCIRYYKQNKNLRNMKDVYKFMNNTMYFKIITIEEYVSEDNSVYCFEMENEEEPYFTLPNGIITHNCRLKSDLKTMGLFSSIVGASSEIGSIKVSTTNLNRIGLDVGFDKDKFFKELKNNSILNLKILNAQRKRIEKNIEKGIMSLYSLGLMKLKNQYSTFGISAFGDVMEGFGFLKTDEFGNQYYTEEGYEFGAKIFEVIDESIKEMNFDFMINKESVPFESGAITCVKKDRLIYGDLVKNELYSNQWLSLGKHSTLQEKIKSASKFDKNCSGGSMLFVNVEGEFTNKEQCWELINNIAKQGVVTINVVTKLSICENEHNYREKTEICPICGAKKIDEATKIVGFYTRKSNWQKERREEDRKWYDFGEANVD